MTVNALDIISSSGIRVLLIDHESGSLSRIHELLTASDLVGFTLDCATSVVAATNKFVGNSHDVCIIDSAKRSASEFLELARRVGCNFPSIVITSSDGTEVLDAFHAGAGDCVLRETLSPSILEQSICKVIQEARINSARIENESRYLGLIENAKDIIYTHDLSGNYTSSNKAAEILTGYTREEVLQLNAKEVVAPEFVAMMMQMVDRKLDAQKETSYELDLVTRQGRRVPVEVNTHLVYSAGRAVGIQGIARDITERRRSELERRVILEIIESVTNTSNLDDLLSSIHQALGKMLYARNCFVALYDKETGFFNCPVFVDETTAAIPRDKLGRGVAAYVFRTGEPVLLNPELFADLVKTGEVEHVGEFAPSWLGVPLKTPSETIGVLVVQDYESDQTYNQRDLEFLNSVGGQIALAIERKRAEQALKRSEEEYRGIFDNAMMGIYRSTPEGNLITANRALAGILGYTSMAELLNCNLIKDVYFDPNERQRIIDRNLPNGSVEEIEVLWKKKDGTPIWIHLNALIILNERGEAIHFDGFVHDISKRKEAEQSLKESEERYQQLVELSPDAIFVHTDGCISFINSSGVRLIGAPNAESVVGQSIYGFIDAEQRPAFIERVARLQHGEVLPAIEVQARTPHVGAMDVEVMSVPFAMHDRPAVQTVVRDITERKQVAQALGEANRRALEDYGRLVKRITALGQSLGNARDLCSVLRAVRDFTTVSVPCAGMVISLYEPEKGLRRPVYCWVDNREIEAGDVSLPVGNGITSTAIKTGEIVIENSYQEFLNKKTSTPIGDFSDGRIPQSALSAPMVIMGRTVGSIEIQTYEHNAYSQDHKTAMSMAASLAANAVENVTLMEREQEQADQLRQSQKMEAVGQLAGGVAHDFNNLLTAISGYTDLGLRKLGDGDPLRRNLEEIKKASTLAGSLTRQLLAFSRKQMLQAKVIDLNAIVSEMDRMLRRLIGEDIDLITFLEPSSCRIKADPGQIEQVVLNLAVNARDAMPRGGKLTIETRRVFLDENHARVHVSVKSGHYIMLAVSDSGVGMDDETKERVFEPFFTTKEVGKGTGLGLSTVYGIVKQSGGTVWVYSEVGKGSTFKVYLPIVHEDVEAEQKPGKTESFHGKETILLVEDEEMVRNLSREILEMNGYRVLTAVDGLQAYRLCESFDDEIHLMVTDVVMPQMSGRELSERVTKQRPNMTVLFMSGYTDDAIVRHGVLDDEMPFLQKPFTPDSLARKVRELLEQQAVKA